MVLSAVEAEVNHNIIVTDLNNFVDSDDHNCSRNLPLITFFLYYQMVGLCTGCGFSSLDDFPVNQ